jgi:hypothetical protein
MKKRGDSTTTYSLQISVIDGRRFPGELIAVRHTLTFAGETKATNYSVGTSNHIWNATISWHLEKHQLRHLEATGLTDCKLVAHSKNGGKLGWTVLDLRTAKLNFRSKKEGVCHCRLTCLFRCFCCCSAAAAAA